MQLQASVTLKIAFFSVKTAAFRGRTIDWPLFGTLQTSDLAAKGGVLLMPMMVLQPTVLGEHYFIARGAGAES